MNKFPRTTVGGHSLSRMIVGTNWFLGYSHTSKAKDDYIKGTVKDRKKIADILEVFFNSGIDTVMGLLNCGVLADAIKDAEDRTGVKGIIVATPNLPINEKSPVSGFIDDESRKMLDEIKGLGATFCMPHQCMTDAMVDRCTHKIRQFEPLCKMIRERGMIPGLSTHMPESIIYADESGLDVETYISIYNSMGFLMQVEIDWIANVIRNAKKPVMTIKPMAAGQIRPFQALNFVWNTIREQDMVTVGTMTPDEARELIEMSFSILEHRKSNVTLQETRSKASIKSKQ